MNICIAGKNEIAVKALEYLLNVRQINKNNLLICPNKTDDGEDNWQPSLKKKGESLRVKEFKLGDLYNIKDLIFISLEFDRIIRPQNFLTKKLFNIHFSLLPKYKGMYTSVFPLLNGETESGVTLHYIDAGIDTGDIIDQIKFAIRINDTCKDLYYNYLHYGFELFKKNINKIINGNFNTLQQPNMFSTYYSKSSVDFENISIDLNKTSFQIHNQIRAFIFKEYQLPGIKGHSLSKSILTNEKIEKNYFKEEKGKLIISGIDGYKIILEKSI